MPTANERKALWFLALVALSGSGVRLWRAQGSAPSLEGSAGLERQIQRAESAAVGRDRATAPKRRSRAPAEPQPKQLGSTLEPLTPPVAVLSVPIDLDRASQSEIESLPGIGPALAKRIVDHRDSAGAFGRLGALCDVRGVGPALVEKLRPLVTFTGPRSPLSDTCGKASKKVRKKPVARGQ